MKLKRGDIMNKSMSWFIILFVGLFLSVAVSNAYAYDIQITKVSQDPIYALPNRVVDLKVMVQNFGQEKIDNFTLTLSPKYPFSSYRELSKTVTLLPYQQGVDAYILDYKMMVAPNTPTGSYNISYTYSYRDATGLRSVTGTLPIDVKNEQTSLVVPNIQVRPSIIRPSSFGNISFSIENVGQTLARDVNLYVVLPKGIGISGVNHRYFSYLYQNNIKNLNYQYYVSSNLKPGIYYGTIVLTYMNDEKTQMYSTNYTFNIVVGIYSNVSGYISKTDLKGSNSESSCLFSFGKCNKGTTTTFDQGDVTITVMNRGTSNIKFTTVKLLPSPDYAIVQGVSFIGNIDNDDYDSADFTIIPKKKNFKLKYEIIWTDYFNKQHTLITSSEVNVSVNSEKSSQLKLVSFWTTIILLTIFWIFMFVDSLTTKRGNKVKKILWIVTVVITFYLGAILYYLFGINKED